MGPPVTDANAEQQEFWNERAGPVWVQNQERLDAQIGQHGQLALDALAIQPGERVLDVGCGCGDSTLKLAEAVGAEGHVLGLDLSEPMLARARQRAEAAGASQVELRAADAQSAALGSDFDVVHSRFGVMFFDDPTRAFTNLCGALRSGGRLGFVCWQAPPENPWVTVPMGAAAPHLELPPPPPPHAPGMFGLADAERLRGILEQAGFADIEIADRRVAMQMGEGTPESAADLFLEVGPVAGLLAEQGASDETRARVRESVLEALRAHEKEGHVSLGSSIWLVTATRP